ncbi:MBL fold metallo-hydrolase [Arthrobacter sp. CDRTa11]|uniref:MBL fold metallo-hydrolase n=1 Tax=Arthrobacter sp. CDRTa11 TaxID=2651199 RepID=UPI002265E151|nr:MBL fold metallo-hydrolase [Arthrobacter sp. CDRTa11]UZX03173.1 MBL fold metallo-hydrolase [Arthrobacter sp. CDRTa11]
MKPNTAQTVPDAGAARLRSGAYNLIGDRVYRLGADIELDDLVSWCPQGLRTRQPVNCYLIKGNDASVLVDTGIRLHEAEVIRQLESLVEPGEPLVVVLTRTEMECCLNLPAIEARFRVEAVWYTGGITVPRSTAAARRIMVSPGTSLESEVADGVTLEFVSPLMRLLPTLWIFDKASGALLTSDAFTHGSYTRSDGLSRPEDGLRKFRWFTEADTRGIADDVSKIVRERNVAAIGPGYGGPFLGLEECAAEADALASAIRKSGLQ